MKFIRTIIITNNFKSLLDTVVFKSSPFYDSRGNKLGMGHSPDVRKVLDPILKVLQTAFFDITFIIGLQSKELGNPQLTEGDKYWINIVRESF